MKFAIFDSGALISLTMNGILETVEHLKIKFPNIIFVITPQVKKETIDKPLLVRKYELGALKIQNLLERNIVSLSSNYVPNEKLEKEANRVMSVSNSIIKADGKFVPIVQIGEASCIAFANLCNCEHLIVIDERVTRLITESPQNLKTIMERRIHRNISLNQKNLKEFKNLRYIRSTELVYLAYKNNLFNYKKDKALLGALMYSLKFSGTSISTNEIEEIKKL